ncbi:hypothetical protein [Variovorax sp. PAMC26660]|uniref:hypothetical protein n=1 Tax=Variovorax sp. PAMC26660 TaxID=2762322 RepID=UPI00164CFDE0|nr:hypothetical protein [Variovorax sp. PAMC26660]QNK65810.1 hypothetical protein H7F35_21670 [Variovorax sp. PAMC26660]
MPTTIVLPGGRRIWLQVVQGVVIEASESSVAMVRQGRDQRQFIEGHAIFRPGRISSEVVSIQKIWIREADGRESAYDLSDFPVDSRPGHTLALIYGAAKGVEKGEFFGALNSTTGKFSFDESIHSDRLSPFGLYLPPKFYLKRMAWGAGIGALVGLLCSLSARMDMSFFVAGTILGFVLSLPVMLVQAVIRQLRGQRLVPELNRRALEVLLSESQPGSDPKG